MFQMPFEEIVERIVEIAGLPREKVESMIDEKVSELNELVSKEGAAHIIANQLGVQLLRTTERKELQLKNLLPGLRNVTVYGRVIRVFEPVEWSKNEKSGKVGSTLISDGTGTARIVLWDKRVEMLNKDIKEGDIIRIVSGYVKKGNFGPEVHLRDDSNLEINPEGFEAPTLASLRSFSERVNISSIEEGMQVSIRAAVVDFIPRNPFFKVCPECNKKLTEESGKFFCKEHGEVKPEESIVVNAIFDDGTGNIRGVLFGKRAEALLGIDKKTLYSEGEKTDFVEALKKAFSNVLGKEFVVSGRARRNTFTNYLEVMVNNISPTNPVQEAKKLIKEIEEETFVSD
jgi:ssDNA-binding replication factor A large subunit